MMVLDRNKFEAILAGRGEKLAGFAKRCGISRQSIYNMFEGSSIFSKSFEKILQNLGVHYDELLEKRDVASVVMNEAPIGVQKAACELEKYAQENGADLFIIGSRARGAKGVRSDWDFAIYFTEKKAQRSLPLTKQKVGDLAFPHRIDVVCLNEAPGWFLKSVEHDAIRLCGKVAKDEIFSVARKERGVA